MKHQLFAFGLLLATGITGVHAQENSNLARGKKFVSSDPNTRNWDTGLTDGSWLPGKGTTYATNDTATFPKHVTIDLEKEENIGYVAIGVPDFGSTKTVSVSLSTDNKEFIEVGRYAFKAGEEEKHLLEFAPKKARYVRLTYQDYNAARKGYTPTFAFTTEVAVYAPGAKPILPPTPTLPEAADAPAPKLGADGKLNGRFSQMHQSFLDRRDQGPIGVLFVGDSITDRWRRDDVKDIWNRFAKYNPANFGIGGDKTQHVLWRFDQGELTGIKPKVVVVMIGTNNTAQYNAEEIIKADTKIVSEIHRRLPDTKVLLLGVFPRSEKPGDAIRAKVKKINEGLAKLDDGNKTRFLDIGDKFLTEDGTLTKEVMPDGLHPGPKGYTIWADAMSPLLDEMMK